MSKGIPQQTVLERPDPRYIGPVFNCATATPEQLLTKMTQCLRQCWEYHVADWSELEALSPTATAMSLEGIIECVLDADRYRQFMSLQLQDIFDALTPTDQDEVAKRALEGYV